MADAPRQPPLRPEIDGDAYAASSSESGGNYNEEGSTMADPGAVPIGDPDEGQPQAEGPDVADAHRSGS